MPKGLSHKTIDAKTGNRPRGTGHRFRRAFRKLFFTLAMAAAISTAAPIGCGFEIKEKPTESQKDKDYGFQKKKLEVIRTVVWNSGKFTQQSLRLLDEIFDNSNFKPEMIDTLKLFVDKAREDPKEPGYGIFSSLTGFKSILEAKNFTPEALKVAESAIKKTGYVDYVVICSLASLVSDRNFDPRVLKIAKIALMNADEDTAYRALSALDILHYRPVFLDKLDEIEILARNSGNAAHAAFSSLSTFTAYGNNDSRSDEFDKALASKVADLFRYASGKKGKGSEHLMGMLRVYFKNKNFRSELLTREFVDRLHETIEFIVQPSKKNQQASIQALGRVLQNPAITPEMLDHNLARRLVTYAKAVSQIKEIPGFWRISFGILQNPSIKHEMLTVALVGKLSVITKIANRMAGKDALSVLDYLGVLLQNPKIDLTVLNERNAKELCSAILYVYRRFKTGSGFYVLLFNPSFTPEMLQTAKLIAKKFKKESDTIFWGFDRLLLNPRFKPEVLKVFERLIIRSSENAKYLPYFIDSILRNKNFNPKVLGILNRMAGKTSQALYAVAFLDSLLQNRGFRPDMLDEALADELCHLVNTAFRKDGKGANNTLMTISKMLQTSKMDFEKISLFRKLFVRSGSNSYQVFSALYRLWNNPGFEGRMFDEQLALKLQGIVARVVAVAKKSKRKFNAVGSLDRVLKNRNFRPEMLDALDLLVKQSGEDVSFALQILDLTLKNRNFRPEMLSGEIGEKLIRVIKQGGEAHRKMKGYVFLLTGILSNPKFNPRKMADERFIPELKEISGYVESSAGKNSRNALALFSSLITNPNFDPESVGKEFASRVVEVVGHILEKKNAQNIYNILRTLFVNKNFHPGTIGKAYVDKIDGIVRHLQKRGEDHASMSIPVFQLAILNKTFTPSLLNKEFAEDLGVLVDRVGEATKKKTVLHARLKVLGYVLYVNPHLPGLVGSIAENYERGKKFAKSLGADHSDPLICMNFAYALNTCGERKARELHSLHGVEYFMRYTPATLRILHRNITSRDRIKPALHAIFNKNDYNGAFYREGLEMERLTRYYRLIVSEVDSQNALYLKAKKTARTYGKPPVGIIGGHGSVSGIILGKKGEFDFDPDEKNLDLTDQKDIKRLKTCFAKNPMIILAACSTGENEMAIGGLLSSSWGARLFAPVTPSAKTVYHLDKAGKILRVTYDVHTREFSNGK